MNILFVIPSYKPAYGYGGPIYSVSKLAESLVSIGHNVTVFTTNANGDDDLDVKLDVPVILDGVTVRYFNRWTRRHSNLSPALLVQLRSVLSTYDIIHVHSWWNLVTIPSVCLCLLKGITPVISPRGTLTGYTLRHRNSLLKRTFHSWIGRRLLERAAFIFTTPREMSEALKLATPKKSFVLPNILDLPTAGFRRNTYGKCLRLLFLGRIDPVKNLEMVIDALRLGLDVEYQWIIAGVGKHEYMNELKARTGWCSKVIWVGHVSGEDKVRLLADADILLLPSHTENYGNVVLESLSQGTTVLVSPHVGLKDYVASQGIGFVVRDNPAEWKTQIERIAKDKSLREEIRSKAPILIQRDFDPVKIAEKHVHAYNEILSCKD